RLFFISTSGSILPTLSLHDALPILFVQPFFALAGREIFRWMYRFLCSFQPVAFVIVAAGYYDEITVLPSFSDACHFDHSFVCIRSEEHTSELQSRFDVVCRLLLDKI